MHEECQTATIVDVMKTPDSAVAVTTSVASDVTNVSPVTMVSPLAPSARATHVVATATLAIEKQATAYARTTWKDNSVIDAKRVHSTWTRATHSVAPNVSVSATPTSATPPNTQ